MKIFYFLNRSAQFGVWFVSVSSLQFWVGSGGKYILRKGNIEEFDSILLIGIHSVKQETL